MIETRKLVVTESLGQTILELAKEVPPRSQIKVIIYDDRFLDTKTSSVSIDEYLNLPIIYKSTQNGLIPLGSVCLEYSPPI